jgi:hypothetical protein
LGVVPLASMTEFPKRLAEWQSEFSERIVRHGDSPSRLPIKAPAYESGGQKFVGSKDAMVLERWTAGTAGYLRHNGREHVLCFAPALSGKGVGLIVPSLLTWLGSAIVHDIKGENWQLTAGWRARCSRVLLFDPTNPVSAAYNHCSSVPFRHYSTDLWRRTLRRRSQKDGFTWDRMTKLADGWFPAPRILHP